MASRGQFFTFIISCRMWKVFAPLNRSHQSMVYSKWITGKNSNSAETSQLRRWGERNIPDVWKLYGRICFDVKKQWVFITSQCSSLAATRASRIYENIDPSKQPMRITITYLVSSRRSIEIWRVCKMYGRRDEGGGLLFLRGSCIV